MTLLTTTSNSSINQQSNEVSKRDAVPAISFIGAGHVAYHLAQAFYHRGIKIHQIYNRTDEAGRELATLVGAQYIEDISRCEPVSMVVIAVSDNSIHAISALLPYDVSQHSIVVHTSGSMPSKLLNAHRMPAGFYPLQTFRKEIPIDLSEVPILITCDNPTVYQRLYDIASLISNHVRPITDEHRTSLHLSAVIVNNFTNHLYQIAYDICATHNVDFQLLVPLIQQTVARLTAGIPPRNMQTGPAIRRDMNTLQRHQILLAADAPSLELYNFMTEHIQQYKP